MKKIRCKKCRRDLKHSRAVFPSAKFPLTCISCLGKAEQEERDRVSLVTPRATVSQALLYLTSRGM